MSMLDDLLGYYNQVLVDELRDYLKTPNLQKLLIKVGCH
jgi:hypothetical protein